MSITRRQYEVLYWIDRFISTEGYSPSYGEIGRGVGLTSTATVHKHVHCLEKKQFLQSQYSSRRSIELTKTGAKVLQTRASSLTLMQAAALSYAGSAK